MPDIFKLVKKHKKWSIASKNHFHNTKDQPSSAPLPNIGNNFLNSTNFHYFCTRIKSKKISSHLCCLEIIFYLCIVALSNIDIFRKRLAPIPIDESGQFTATGIEVVLFFGIDICTPHISVKGVSYFYFIRRQVSPVPIFE